MASHSFSSKMQVDSNQDLVYETIAEVISITLSGPEINKTKSTHLNSVDATHEYIAGFTEPGEVTFNMRFTKAQYNTLYSLYRLTRNWRILAADGSTWTTAGFWTKLGLEIPEDDTIMNEVTIQLSGKPVFVQG